MTIELKRVIYGKKKTLPEDREYQLASDDVFGAVGTLKEWKKMFPNDDIVIIEDKIK